MNEQTSFMSPDELAHIRKVVLSITQSQLVETLIDPNTGRAITKFTLSRWESGKVRVPLWAARRMRELESVAKIYDKEVGSSVRPNEELE